MLHTHETVPESAWYPLSPITVEYNTDGSQVKSSHLILLERQHVIMRKLPGRSVPSPYSAQRRDNYGTCFSRANSEVPSPTIELFASGARRHKDFLPELLVPQSGPLFSLIHTYTIYHHYHPTQDHPVLGPSRPPERQFSSPLLFMRGKWGWLSALNISIIVQYVFIQSTACIG